MCGCIHLYACMWKSEEDIKHLLLILCYIILIQGLSLNLKSPFWPGWLPRELPGSTCLFFLLLGLQACTLMPEFLYGCWGFELRPLCFQNKHSYLLNHLLSLLKNFKVKMSLPKYLDQTGLCIYFIISVLFIQTHHSWPPVNPCPMYSKHAQALCLCCNLHNGI